MSDDGHYERLTRDAEKKSRRFLQIQYFVGTFILLLVTIFLAVLMYLNLNILKDVQKNTDRIDTTDDAIVCILLIEPEDRNKSNIGSCKERAGNDY